MTTITILPEKADSYRALAGEKESTGRTAGEALDALAAQLDDDESGTLVIVQNRKADKFFTAEQQERLAELMQFREARNLSPEEERELESLVEAELVGARERTEVLTGTAEHEKQLLDETSADIVKAALIDLEGILKALTEQDKRGLMQRLEDSLLKELDVRVDGERRSRSRIDLRREDQLEHNSSSPAEPSVDEKTD